MGSEPVLPDDLAESLSEQAVLNAFEHLPESDQANFVKWVSAPASPEERRRRALILRDALRLSPLAWEDRPELPNSNRGQSG